MITTILENSVLDSKNSNESKKQKCERTKITKPIFGKIKKNQKETFCELYHHCQLSLVNICKKLIAV